MTFTDILLLARAAGEAAAFFNGLAVRLQLEQRNPSQDEIDQVKQRQKRVEEDWAKLLPRD